MDKNKPKSSTDITDMVELISDEEVRTEMGSAFASFMLNPTVIWAKFILTDDRKNANGQRIPKEEFANLMRSGIHMPVKMAIGEIERGHDGSEPLGVITHLKEISTGDGTSAIVALAALWGQERPADVQFIRERFRTGEPVNVSWEILYGDALFNEEIASIDLRDTVLRAATVVGEPAYEGRTQFLAVAAKKWGKAYIEKLPDSSFLYVDGNGERYIPIMDADGTVERTRLSDAMTELGQLNLPGNLLKEKKGLLQHLIGRFEAGASINEVSAEYLDLIPPTEEAKLNTIEELKAELARVQGLLDEATATVQTKETALSEREATLAEKDAEITRLTELTTQFETELAPLREFKASADAEIQRKEKLDKVRTKFVEAGIQKDDQYFTDNEETLAAMTDEQLDFMVQELKAFAATKTSESSKKTTTKIPALTNEDNSGEQPSIQEMAAYLRERKAKK